MPPNRIALVLLSVCLTVSARATVILDDTFADGSRTNQNLPSSAAWYVGVGTTALTAATGNMTLAVSGTSNIVLGYFTNSGSPITLTPGSAGTITLSYAFTVQGINSTGGFFRAALYNSGGNRISADGAGVSNSTYQNYTGYLATSVLKTGANSSIGYFRRDGASNPLMTTTTNPPYTSLSSSSALSGFQLVDGVSYVGTLSISYNGTAATITNSFSGGSLSGISYSYTDNTPDLSFDTAAFAVQGTALNSITFSDIKVSVVPEPATNRSVLLGLVSLLLVGLLKRRSLLVK